jgi:PAS domain S-box-containing protein
MDAPKNADFTIDLEALYEDAPCGYLSFSSDGTIIKINRTLLRWLGYEESLSIISKLRFKDLVTRGGALYYEMFYFPLLQLQSKVNEISFDFIKKDGSLLPALVNSSVLRDAGQKIMFVNVTVHDISDRKRYETELLEAKKRADIERGKFEFLSDFIPEMIWTADASGSLNYVNRRVSDFFGLQTGDVSFADILARVYLDDQYRMIRNWLVSVKTLQPFQAEVRLQTDHQTYKWYAVHAIPLGQSEKNGTKWMGACNDIDKHVVALRDLDGFISIAGHELKTPITSLKASFQLLDKLLSQSSAPVPMLISQIQRGIGKMNALVEDLLSAGSIREGQMLVRKTTFNVLGLLESACSHLRFDKKYHVAIECHDLLDYHGDENRIEQVLVNFLNNAVKYAPDSKEIKIRVEKKDAVIRFSVTDQGPGILPEKIPHVFDRFYRVTNAAGSYSGLGLGLYICSEIIKRHDGQIGVESPPGEGCTFWFELPAH